MYPNHAYGFSSPSLHGDVNDTELTVAAIPTIVENAWILQVWQSLPRGGLKLQFRRSAVNVIYRTGTHENGNSESERRETSASTETQGKMQTKRASGLARKVGNTVWRDGDESTDIELGWILMISFRAIISAIPPEKCVMGVCGVQIQASG